MDWLSGAAVAQTWREPQRAVPQILSVALREAALVVLTLLKVPAAAEIHSLLIAALTAGPTMRMVHEWRPPTHPTDDLTQTPNARPPAGH